jgi:hypothetical protein
MGFNDQETTNDELMDGMNGNDEGAMEQEMQLQGTRNVVAFEVKDEWETVNKCTIREGYGDIHCAQ